MLVFRAHDHDPHGRCGNLDVRLDAYFFWNRLVERKSDNCYGPRRK